MSEYPSAATAGRTRSRARAPRRLMVAVVLGAHCLGGVAARAQAPAAAAVVPADAAAMEAAKRHFMQAIALYNDGNFDAALAEFQAAYRTKPAPSILYNIGLTYKSLFLYNDAIRSLEQFLREEIKLAPERRAEVEQLLREMNALLADVQLAITPEGASVKIDGRTVGRAPIGQYLIAAGRHVLEVSLDGYTSQTKELMVTAGVPMAVAISLAVIPKTGRVKIVVAPSGASLKVDGRVYPPPVDLELPLGGHTVEAWATGYQVHREELLIAPGQTRDVSINLRRASITKRAAFIVPITIGSILIAGGIAVGVAASQTNNFKGSEVISGTLDPGSAAVGR